MNVGCSFWGGFVALELRNEAKLASEIERAIEFGHFFKSLGGQLLIAADSGDPFRLAQSGRVDPTSGLKKHEWRNLTSGLDQIGNRPLDPTTVARRNRTFLEALLDELGIEPGRESRGDHRNHTELPLAQS